jgi:hypothetical protein
VRNPPPAPQSATYLGKVSGNTMALQVFVSGSQTPLSFTLVFNSKPTLLRCL